MALRSHSEMYETGLKLAEAGQHEQALDCFTQHLSRHPRDAEAWNDAAAVLYCLGRVDEAIHHFEKARALSGDTPQSAEIIWNLCEAYMDGGCPREAASLLPTMDKLGILSPDVMNRIANSYLKQEEFGNAMEMLIRSLEAAPQQDVLRPMIKVIRSKRARVALFGSADRDHTMETFEFMDTRLQTTFYDSKQMFSMNDVLQECDIAWFEGYSDRLEEAMRQKPDCQVVVRLYPEDVVGDRVGMLDLSHVQVLVVPDMPGIEKSIPSEKENTSLKIVRLAAGINVEKCDFVDRSRGKRIACIGPFNAENNMILLLQCMQKLNYIDADYRLYLAGEFEDASLGCYARHMVNTMGLSHVVQFEGTPENLSTWLQDKHYVASTSITDQNVRSILRAMACGLKPVIHHYPGARDVFEEEFLFEISEQFCEQITSGAYDPQRYSRLVRDSHSIRSEVKVIHNILTRFEQSKQAEKRVAAKYSQNPTAAVDQADVTTTAPASVAPVAQEPQFDSFQPQSHCEMRDETASFEIVGKRQGSEMAACSEPSSGVIPIVPIKPEIPNEPVASAPGQGQVPLSRQKGHGDKPHRIGRIAAAALEASRTLAELAKQDGPQQPASWDSNTADETLSRTGGSCLDDTLREQQVAKVANEFARESNARVNESMTRDQTVPFTTK